MILNVSRRTVLRGLAAAPFVLQFPARPAGAAPTGATLGAFLALDRDGTITFLSPFVEMGQGVYTALPQIIAEEMDADLDRFRVEQAPIGAAYRMHADGALRITAGSSAVRLTFPVFRAAGAAARAMLIAAAAERWGLPADGLTTRPGEVLAPDGRRLSYGDLAEDAARQTPPDQPALKDPAAFRLIGQPVRRLDTPAKITGRAVYAIDVTVPGMAVAALRHAPRFGSEPLDLDPAAARGMPGVLAVETLPGAVAVVAESFWQAKTALDSLDLRWTDSPLADLSSAALLSRIQARLYDPGEPHMAEGETAVPADEIARAIDAAPQRVEATYAAPFLAHVAIEPMVAVADVRPGAVDLWVENQGPELIAARVAEALAIPVETIAVHTPFAGGGFGRRLDADAAVQAAMLSARLARPVKLIWPREEDMGRDRYRPLSTVRFRAGLGADGRVTGFHATAAGDGPMRQFWGMGARRVDLSVTGGLGNQGYQFGLQRIDYVYEPIPIGVGWWRSVASSQNGFFIESFIDELAAAAGQDPLAFRRSLLPGDTRRLAVLDAVARIANWQGPGPFAGADGAPRARGIALHEEFGSVVAQIAEVTLRDGTPVVERVWCAIDVGQAVNPRIITAQVTGAIVMGLSQALHEELVIEAGAAVQTNFDTYDLVRMDRTPEITVEVLQLGGPMGGVGEPGVPPAAPAIANALAALTGRRVRDLPITPAKLG